jgi:GNAT superfamily N-acetyltransferase
VMDIALDRARVGERWVLRIRLADGSATDVIGWLVDLGADQVVVEVSPVQQVPVETAAVILARRAPAARGGPDPRRTSAEDLERAALPGWLALSEPLGDWTLRAGGGFTGRANSALAVGDPGLPLDEAAERVVAYARRHGIAPWAQVIVGSAMEAGLVERGWHPTYVVTDVLVCRLVTLLGDDLPDPRVTVDEDLDDAWLTAYGRSRPSSVSPAVLRMILAGHPPRAFAAVPDPAGRVEPVAIARGHVSGPWLGIASVWTEPDHRRRGLATAMMRALGHWAARQEARQAYLQVAQENTGAHDAYARLGFAVHHSYRYLAAPEQPSGTDQPSGTA